jgi:sialic acid synthase SpsE|tara:strand:- start:2141 stop:3148 length:1008 start_codon:yes stop_codon:yes gene_type:complete
MKIGDFDLNKDILIIAEIGNNHEGSYALAEEMIGLAAQAGAGAVKFQTFIPERTVSSRQKESIEQLKRFQLTYNEFEKLSQVAKNENVIFLSTPFDIESVKFLETLVPAYKIASGDNNFFPMIDVIAHTGKPIIMSVGLIDFTGVKNTIDFIKNIWNKNAIDQDVAVLHCVSLYPTPPDEANLLAIEELKRLNVTVGYSDHTVGNEAAVISVVLGARIVEKHFTIDKNYSDFRDHQLSADPKEMAWFVQQTKRISTILGKEEIVPQDREKDLVKSLRRSIVASRDLQEKEVIGWGDITWIRPGNGLPPGKENLVLGKQLKKPLKMGDQLNPDELF